MLEWGTVPDLKLRYQKPLALLLIGLHILYFIALTCSVSGMEIFGWGIVLFFFIFKWAGGPAKLYKTGLELPIFGFILAVFLSLVANGVPINNFVYDMGRVRNFVLLLTFSYSFQVIPKLRRLLIIFVVSSTLVGIYAIWQHFSGTEILWRGRFLDAISEGAKRYASNGFFGLSIYFAHSATMWTTVPWAALLLSSKGRGPREKILFAMALAINFAAVICTFKRGAWLSLLVALPLMSFYVQKKWITRSIFGVLGVFLILFCVSDNIRLRALSTFDNTSFSNGQRLNLWAANIQMFKEHPLLGVGFIENEPLSKIYYEKLNIPNGLIGHAHNNFLGILSSTGLVGFFFFLWFIAAAMIAAHKTYLELPHEKYWARVIVLSSIGAQWVFHIGGLTQWTFGVWSNQHFYFTWIALTIFLRQPGQGDSKISCI